MQKVYNPVNRQPPTTTQQPGIHRLFGRKCRKSMIRRIDNRRPLLSNPECIDYLAENAESLWFSEPAPANHYSITRNTSTLRQKMQEVYNLVNRHCHGILHYTLPGNCIFTFFKWMMDAEDSIPISLRSGFWKWMWKGICFIVCPLLWDVGFIAVPGL